MEKIHAEIADLTERVLYMQEVVNVVDALEDSMRKTSALMEVLRETGGDSIFEAEMQLEKAKAMVESYHSVLDRVVGVSELNSAKQLLGKVLMALDGCTDALEPVERAAVRISAVQEYCDTLHVENFMEPQYRDYELERQKDLVVAYVLLARQLLGDVIETGYFVQLRKEGF